MHILKFYAFFAICGILVKLEMYEKVMSTKHVNLIIVCYLAL